MGNRLGRFEIKIGFLIVAFVCLASILTLANLLGFHGYDLCLVDSFKNLVIYVLLPVTIGSALAIQSNQSKIQRMLARALLISALLPQLGRVYLWNTAEEYCPMEASKKYEPNQFDRGNTIYQRDADQ